MKHTNRVLSIVAIAFIVWCSSCLLWVLNAAGKLSERALFGASFFLTCWLIWSIFVISDRQREKNSTDMIFRFCRSTSRLPDEFDRFCSNNGICERNQFVEQAVIEKMGRYERQKADKSERNEAERLGITVERYRMLQDSIRRNAEESIIRKEKTGQI